MSGPNAQQIAYWNEEAGPRWAALQPRIDSLLGAITTDALNSAAPQPGEIVLDVGCGFGTTALELARRVESDGRVVGIDVSRPMLALATERARDERLSNVTFVLADASTFEFERAAFDLAFSRFGVMFFDDPVAAFANIKRGLRPGGRLAFLCFRELADNLWFAVPLRAAEQHLPAREPGKPDDPGPFAFASAARVRSVLEEAGFSAIDLERRDTKVRLGEPNNLEETATVATQLGPVARIFREADAPAQSKARAAVVEALREHETPDGILLPSSVWFVTAVSP